MNHCPVSWKVVWGFFWKLVAITVLSYKCSLSLGLETWNDAPLKWGLSGYISIWFSTVFNSHVCPNVYALSSHTKWYHWNRMLYWKTHTYVHTHMHTCKHVCMYVFTCICLANSYITGGRGMFLAPRATGEGKIAMPPYFLSKPIPNVLTTFGNVPYSVRINLYVCARSFSPTFCPSFFCKEWRPSRKKILHPIWDSNHRAGMKHLPVVLICPH